MLAASIFAMTIATAISTPQTADVERVTREGVGDEPLVIPAVIATQVSPYLECVSAASDARAAKIGSPSYQSQTGYRECDQVRETARLAALNVLENHDVENRPDVDALFDRIVGFFTEIEARNARSFARAVAGKSYTIPDGMWDYHVCRTFESGGRISLNGKPVEPRFKDDPDCKLALEYSKKQALIALDELGEPVRPKDRVNLVERYIAEIDSRTLTNPTK